MATLLVDCSSEAGGSSCAPIEEMVGSGAAMVRLRLQLQRLGPHFRTVLLRGEAGTGKGLAAGVLHRATKGGAFVVCSPGEGSTRSAEELDRLVKQASGGTLFLRAVEAMPVEAQEHLVNVLRRQECSQGATATQRLGVRIVASTCEDVRVLAFAGRFQQELYQRLAMVEIGIPALRERMEDIPELAICLLERLRGAGGDGVVEVSPEGVEWLKGRLWPGNVRELEEVLRQAMSRCEGQSIEVRHLEGVAEIPAVEDLAGDARLQDVVEAHVLRVLKRCGGNKLRAAEVLGISRSTLYRMLEATAASS